MCVCCSIMSNSLQPHVSTLCMCPTFCNPPGLKVSAQGNIRVCVLLNCVQLFATTYFHFVHVSNILHPTRAEGVCSGEHSCVCIAQLYPALCKHIFSTHCVCVAQLSPTRCNPMNCSLPSSSVHGTLQARKLEWVAIPFCKGSS